MVVYIADHRSTKESTETGVENGFVTQQTRRMIVVLCIFCLAEIVSRGNIHFYTEFVRAWT